MALVVKNTPANAGDLRDTVSIPGSGISPGGGNGNLLQYFSLENSMDRGAPTWGCKESDSTEIPSLHAMTLRKGLNIINHQWPMI